MPSLLIIDDTAFMRMTLSKVLSENGFAVVAEAGDGVEAVEAYRQHQPDLTTMAITMPRMDGLQAIEQIRAEFPDAAIVACSAMGQKELVMQALQLGAKDFIIKPFEEEGVLEALRRALP